MSAFSSLSEFWQTMLPFIMLVEIVLEIGLFMYQLLRSNKPVRSLLSLAVMAVMIPLLFSVSRADPDNIGDAFLLGAPWLIFAAAIFLAAVHFAIALPQEYRRKKNELSPFSIKEATDKLPMGICFADPNGRIILCNNRMRRLSFALCGHELQIKSDMENALSAPDRSVTVKDDCYILPDKTVWQFRTQTITVESDDRWQQITAAGAGRHESRRIDNQLRGRSGRQGDPGESRFYIALTDDVMRLFGSERMQSMMETLRVDEDTPLDHKMLSNAIEQAQRTVESRNFQARKNVLEYDDVMNVQRNVIYEERRKVLDGEDLQEHVQHMIRTVITGDIAAGMAEHHPENDKDLHEILAPLEKLFPCDLSYTAEELHKLTPDTLSDAVYDCAMKAYAAREEAFGLQPDGTPLMRELERVVMLRVVDEYWMDHLEAMDDLRQGIGLRAYGNVKPVDEYKRAGFDMFDEMVNGIQSETVRRLFTVRVRREQKLERKTVARSAATNAGGDDSEKKRPVRRVKKPGRNDPCPCGKLRPNGLPMKYKDCCGKNA